MLNASPLIEPHGHIIPIRPTAVQLRREKTTHDYSRDADNTDTSYAHMHLSAEQHRIPGDYETDHAREK